MKFSIEQYEDRLNDEDKGNGCYYIIVSLAKKGDIENNLYSMEISEHFNIDFLELAKKHDGFLDGLDIFFKVKYRANNCIKELRSIINKKQGE